ncbi:hypothetical protein OIDMADRAFT_59487 [Oidiodendron maius Zn]|uniref:Zn(2)-C6 fungal-type domain-containing protein n=1 Tax=Oidiodendron maius (strain Zn) TaxID=913774 RepID=A0A0C3GZP5_OIDMZ|nr:hypothetical protein OIDMADRAFT_59487 [Oidiodendron maius Zn]
MEWASTFKGTGGYALHACEICKTRKRKCDRRLPQCSLCARYLDRSIARPKGIRLILHSFKNRACRYADHGDQVSSDISRDVNQLGVLSQKTRFPSVYFLDRDVFQQSLVEIPNPSLPLSLQLNILLGNDSEIHHIASRFFDHTHPFMPIISKQLFYTRHLSPLAPPKTDILLLCFCMKIFTWMPSEKISDPQTHDYLSAKHFIVEIEAAGIFTLQVLQANLLVAIYELGHGIYPSANLTIGACATRGIALDLERELTARTTSQFTWVEEEERRRVWWAIIILERVASLGWPSRTLITKDPTSQHLLPVDDSAWDDGVGDLILPSNFILM